MSAIHEQFMAEALTLARRGRGLVEPNPMVGAVIVRDGVVLGRGWHRRFGGPHAEIEALRDARASGADPRGAAMYVTLEPCCHHGKTPPCTDALIGAGIGSVIVAMEDPDAHVAGGGISQLRAAGIEVTVGIRQAQARELLRAYVKLRTLGRPWVICKWAQTADGYIALPDSGERWISGEDSRRRVHLLRGRCDAILVGVDTALADDPLLTNRASQGKQPARIVLDSHLRLPLTSRLVETAGESAVIVAATIDAIADRPAEVRRLRARGAEVLELPPGPGGVSLDALLDNLGRRMWTYLLVEGGAKVLAGFIHSHLADELQVFIAPKKVNSPDKNLPRFDIADVQKTLNISPRKTERVGPDTLMRFVLSKS